MNRCKECGGKGWIRYERRLLSDPHLSVVGEDICPTCEGSGEKFDTNKSALIRALTEISKNSCAGNNRIIQIHIDTLREILSKYLD